MRVKKQEIWIVALALAALIFTIAVQVPLEPSPSETEKSYRVEENRLINCAQGYSFAVPDGFVLNDTFYPYNLRLESDNTVIEIYCEDLDADQQISYINYSNQAITKNDVDYTNVQQLTDENISVLRWDRKALSRIHNDKNHYLKMDIPADGTVYTLLVKSAQPITDHKTYTTLFQTEEKTMPIGETFVKKQPAKQKFNTETKKLYKNVFQKSDRITWGIFHPDFMKSDSLAQYESKINHKFDFNLWYTGFTKTYSPETIEDVLEKSYADGKVTVMTLQPRLTHEKGNDIFKLLDGEYDSFLDNCAKAVANFKHPVLLRLANEMNGDWCEYSAYQMSLDTELYREFYKYVFSFFEKYHANNIIRVFNPNGKSFPDFKWNAEDMYYPGDAYVDVYGLTLYNTGNYYEGEEWTEFSDLYKPLYEASMKKYDMPFMITEFSCARAGGNKEEWTKKMFSEIGSYENIKLAIWWNHADFDENGNVSRAYYINDSEEMVQIFKEYFSDK